MWERMAFLIKANYGNEWVNWEEEYAVCPYCGEKIYLKNWASSDLIDGLGNFMCPICGDMIQ